jgi:hypothetical protein
VQPDIVAFSKKAQVGGIMAGGRVDEVPDNVFRVSGRINSTWGGNLVDMVRAGRILEIIESDNLIEACRAKGRRLVSGLEVISAETGTISNVRGRGLFVACDLPTPAERDALIVDLRKTEHVIVLPCGVRSVRFRPALSVSEDDLDEAVAAVRRSVIRICRLTRRRRRRPHEQSCHLDRRRVAGDRRPHRSEHQPCAAGRGRPARSRSPAPPTFVRAAEAAKARATGMGCGAAPMRGRAIAPHRSAGRGQRGGAGPAGDGRDRQAAR